MKLTINILVKNNEDTIEETLESIHKLDSKILVGNFGSSDKTLDICKKFDNLKIIELKNKKNISYAKNELIKESKTTWNLCIEPWEVLFTPSERVMSLLNNEICSYRVNILQDDLITKQIRLWNRNKNLYFKNPIFETLKDKNSKYSEIYFISRQKKEFTNTLEAIERWRDEKPLSCEPLYYLAFYYLSKKEWDKFLNYANLYLFQEKTNSISLIMTHYYCSMVKCYIDSQKKLNEAISHIIYCLSEKPLMAEFWCLLGDIHYSLNDYEKSKVFYENGMLLGTKRLKEDEFPIEISKYKEYPNKMIENCKKIKDAIKIYSTNKENQVH